MATLTHPVLLSLRAEHDDIRRLLDVFEHELQLFCEGGKADYDVLADALDVCDTYLRAVHHAVEDRILEALQQSAPEHAEGPNNVSKQHIHLDDLLSQVSQGFSQVRDGAITSREELRKSSENMVAHYRHHLEQEEEHFLPTAQAQLSDAQWAAIAADWPHGDGLLEGRLADDRYAAVLRRMQQMIARD